MADFTEFLVMLHKQQAETEKLLQVTDTYTPEAIAATPRTAYVAIKGMAEIIRSQTRHQNKLYEQMMTMRDNLESVKKELEELKGNQS